MEKTCPKCFDVECVHLLECEIPRLLARCQHLQINVDSEKVFMGNPVRNCTVICTRTERPFGQDELTLVINCTQEKFENGTCPRAKEPGKPKNKKDL